MAAYYSTVWKDHILFIHSSVDGHLGCFYSLAVVNSAAVNIHVQVFLRITTLSAFEYVPWSGITE